jgi:hypothetical protein
MGLHYYSPTLSPKTLGFPFYHSRGKTYIPKLYPDAPWCWNIDLQNWAIFGVNVGKYSSTMEHMGYIIPIVL